MVLLIVIFKTKKIEKICTDYSIAQKEYGKDIAIKVFQRIEQIRASSSVDELIKYNIGRCHPLIGNRSGQYAMDLVNPYRLVFLVESIKEDTAIIIEVIDYH